MKQLNTRRRECKFAVCLLSLRFGQGRRQGGLWGAEAPQNVGWGPTPGVMGGGPRHGCRQGNGGLVVGWWVACGKNMKSY
jgi:hypothetical protein